MNILDNKLNYIADIFWNTDNKNNLDILLKDILTPQEIETLYERFQIIKLLRKWLSQREIAEKLGISTTTVNRWARILKYGSWVLNDLKL